MKNYLLSLIVIFTVSISAFSQLPYLKIEGCDTTIDSKKYEVFINNHPFTTREPLLKEDIKKLDKEDRPDLAYEHDWLMTHDPKDGKIHWERLIPVLKKLNASSGAILGVAPGGSTSNKWIERGPNDKGGRVRAIMFDPNDATNKKVFAGGVGGGLWYNTDITSTTSSWIAVNDFWANLAVSSLSYDPQNKSTLYCATGEGFRNADALRGAGLWKSTNKGSTWTQLNSTNNSSFRYINKVIVTGTSRIVLAASGGIYTSDNGGTSFTRRISGSYADVEIATNGDLYCGTLTSGRVYKSTNNGNTWSTITPSGTTARRIEIACAPSDSNTVYAIGSSTTSSNTDVSWFKKSTNGGSSWTNLTIPTYFTNSSYHFTRKQAWYDLILWVHPTNKNIVIAGGVDLHRTTNGGSSWSGISYWTSSTSLPYVHADQHAIISRPGNSSEILVGNDGGIFYSSNAGNSSTSKPTFSHKVKNLNVTQLYAGAFHPSAGSNVITVGAQDNGSMKLSSAGVGGNTYLTGGDGAFCFIDQTNSNVFITSYVYNNWRRSTNSGGFFNYLPSDNTGRFINPSDYDDNLNILYAAKTSTVIKRISNMTGSYSISDVSVSSLGGTPSHIRVSPYTTSSSTLFVGANSDVYKITNANSTPSVTKITPSTFPTEYISCVEVGASEKELLVTFSSYGGKEVYYTANSGTTWVDKSGNLPDMPIRWALFNPKNRKEVIVATELGVWSTDDITASSPNWSVSNNGLANTRVDMLQYRASDSLILAATHGRGAFTGRFKAAVSNAPVASFTTNKDTICVGETVTYTSTSTNSPTSLSWTMFGGVPSLASGSPVSTTYGTSGLKSVTLIATNSSGSNSKTQSLVYVSSKPTASISAISQKCVSDPSIILNQGSPSGGVYSGPGVSSGVFSPSSAGIGTHTIKYTVTNSAGCSDVASTTVKVTSRPSASASSMPDVCSNSPSITLSNGSPTGGVYSGPGVSSGVFSPSAAGTGTHTIKYLFGTATCKDSATFTIKVNAAPTVTLAAIGPFCTSNSAQTLTQGSPTGGVYSGAGVSGSTFSPSMAGVGNHLVKYVVTNSNGCKDSANTMVSVSSGASVSATTVPDMCSNAPNLTLNNASPSGGTYSGTGVSSGVFNPTTAGTGTHSIKYILGTGTCKDSTTFIIKVLAAPNVSLSTVGPFCTSDPTQTLTQGTPSGGVYSGTGVTGTSFSPSVAGAGSHAIKYKVTSSNGCKDSSSTNVSVFSGGKASATSIPNQCTNSPVLVLTNGSPSGGTYSGTGVSSGSFTPSIAGVGTHSIKYLIGGASCKDSVFFSIKVDSVPKVSLTAIGPFCLSDPTQTLNGSPAGGVYTGTGVTGNSFNPSSAGIGAHSIQYKVSNSAGCTDSVTISVSVGNGTKPTLGSFNNICADAAPITLTGGLPTGGTYSGVGVSAGKFDPSIAGPGSHTISYTHSTACAGIKATATIKVDSLPNLIVTPDTSVCLGASLQLSVSGARSYVWSPGSTLNDTSSSTPVASPLVNTKYSVSGTSSAGCKASVSVNISINPLPSVNAGKDDTACAGIAYQLNASGTMTYVWSPSGNLSNSNIANPLATLAGNTVFTVLGIDSNGCSNSDSVRITVLAKPSANLDPFSDVCVKASSVVLTGGKPTGGTYSGSGVSSGSFNPSTAGLGTHTITYTVTNGKCSGSATETITVVASPTISWQTSFTYCDNETAISPGAKPTGGVFSGSAISNGNIDPVKLGVGRYEIKYSYSDTSGCSATDSKEIVVNPTTPVDSIRGIFQAVINRTYNYNVSAVNGSSYLWTITGGKVLSSNSNLITIKWGTGPKGYLHIIQTNQFGCVDSTNAEVFLAPLSTDELTYGGGELKLFPNPASDVLFVELNNINGLNNLEYNLVSMDGKVVKTGVFELESGKTTREIKISEIPNGIYFFQTSEEENLIITPVIVSK